MARRHDVSLPADAADREAAPSSAGAATDTAACALRGGIGAGAPGAKLTESDVERLCASAVGVWGVAGKRILLIVPDGTRTVPMDLLFRVLHKVLSAAGAGAIDVLVALGTHPPMSDEAIGRRFGLTDENRRGAYARTRFENHRWSDPEQLVSIGTIPADDIEAISSGRLRERVNVTMNKLALAYDLLLIVGPTFPHEVVGFSGGNKYLFPGIAGPEIIDMFHWLGALITSPAVIGTKWTPVRAVVDTAAAMVPVERKCVSVVIEGGELAGLYAGAPEDAWSAAADLSSAIHVVRSERAYASVLSCAPRMYGDLWVGGKCAYKLEPVVADGGELVIYAPHVTHVSETHGEVIRRIGYHVRDYFLANMPRFAGVPRGVMAHSTHVKGVGTYADGVESPRIRVTLATGIGEAECRALNLGYRDHRTIDPEEWRRRDGFLHVPRAGEVLYRLADSGSGRWRHSVPD